MARNGSSQISAEVEAAIREAVAGKQRPSDVLRRLRAGTIEELGPVQIPERTFYRRWSAAKREQSGATYTGPSILYLITLHLAREKHGITDDPTELAEATGIPLADVRELLAMEAKVPELGPVSDQIEERRRRAEGRPPLRARS